MSNKRPRYNELKLTDLPQDEAFAIGNALGLIVWVSQTLLLIVLGLISWFLIPKKI